MLKMGSCASKKLHLESNAFLTLVREADPRQVIATVAKLWDTYESYAKEDRLLIDRLVSALSKDTTS
jgi:hypothetical protein